MSNDPFGQTVNAHDQSDNPYSTTTMETVVGDVKVGDSSYDIQGNVVDSSKDTPIDVNAVHGVEVPEGGLNLPSTGLTPQFETDSQQQPSGYSDQKEHHSFQGVGTGSEESSQSIQQNPEQTFMPHDTMNDAM